MAKLSDFSQGVLTTVIIIYISAFVYAIYFDHKEREKDSVGIYTPHEHPIMDWLHHQKYRQFSSELHNDMDKYEITQEDQDILENTVNKILESREKKKSLFRRMVNSGKTGFLLGGMSGGITSGSSGALATGILFGLINPIIVVINEFLTIPEELPGKMKKQYK